MTDDSELSDLSRTLPSDGASSFGDPRTTLSDGEQTSGTGLAVEGKTKRGPVVRIAVVVLAMALGWGSFYLVKSVWSGRNDKSPISTSTRAASGSLIVTSHGITISLPSGWVNIPTTPNQLAQFVKDNSSKYPEMASLVNNQQAMRTLAMLVWRFDASGNQTASLTAVADPETGSAQSLRTAVAGVPGRLGGINPESKVTTFRQNKGVLMSYTLPAGAGLPTRYAVQTYVIGSASTAILTITTYSANDSLKTATAAADSVKFG